MFYAQVTFEIQTDLWFVRRTTVAFAFRATRHLGQVLAPQWLFHNYQLQDMYAAHSHMVPVCDKSTTHNKNKTRCLETSEF